MLGVSVLVFTIGVETQIHYEINLTILRVKYIHSSKLRVFLANPCIG